MIQATPTTAQSPYRTGYLLAQLCQCAYADRPQSMLPHWVMDSEPFASEGRGFAARSGREAILVFRGTKTLDDTLIDLECRMRGFGLGYAHRGFSDAANSRLSAYLDALQAIERRSNVPIEKLYIAGHSLGGALATIVGRLLVASSTCAALQPAVYTFGSPRVFDRVGAWEFDKILPNRHHRFAAVGDPVPMVPVFAPEVRLYHHCGTGYTLPRSWAAWAARKAALLPRWWRSIWSGMESALRCDMANHHITNYLSDLRPR